MAALAQEAQRARADAAAARRREAELRELMRSCAARCACGALCAHAAHDDAHAAHDAHVDAHPVAAAASVGAAGAAMAEAAGERKAEGAVSGPPPPMQVAVPSLAARPAAASSLAAGALLGSCELWSGEPINTCGSFCGSCHRSPCH